VGNKEGLVHSRKPAFERVQGDFVVFWESHPKRIVGKARNMFKLLTTPAEMSKALRGAMREYQHYRWSVAWASSGFPLFDELLKKRSRVSQLVVGTHFYQTHPDFLMAFLDDPDFRVVLQPSGVFHPKVYLFENNRDDWACVIGSPNFTGAAFSVNAEVAMRFDSTESGANLNYEAIRKVIDEHSEKGKPLTKELLDSCRSIWKQKAPLLGGQPNPASRGHLKTGQLKA
jgi:HKD family nuclease